MTKRLQICQAIGVINAEAIHDAVGSAEEREDAIGLLRELYLAADNVQEALMHRLFELRGQN